MTEFNISLGELRERFFNGGADELEYFDEITGTWKDLSSSYYFERISGFPVPEKAAEPITLFQIYDSKKDTMIVLGLREWKHQDRFSFNYPVKYIKCDNEIHMIETFLSIFEKLDPLIIYAWNGAGFDFPYIHNRMKVLGFDTNRLSNYGNVTCTQSEFQGKTEFKFNSDGHFYIDLMNVYKTFTFHPMTSYSLDNVAEYELGENKVQHTEYTNFDDFYSGKYILPDNPSSAQKESWLYQYAIENGVNDELREMCHSEFVYYGIKDTYLIKQLDESKNFTAIMSMIAEKMGVQIGDSTGTVKPWSQYIANKSMLNMQVMPCKQDFPIPHVVGGFVREPVKGRHRWVLSADVNSMYPLLGMVGFNMSPETFIPKHKLPPELRDIILSFFNDQEEEKRFNIPKEVWHRTTQILQEHNLTLAINGAVFSKDKLGIVPEMVHDIYASRKEAKKKMFDYTKRSILIKEIIKDKLCTKNH